MSLNRWTIPFKNDSAESVPPFGVMRVTGIETIGGRPIVKIGKPNTYGSQYSHYVNGPIEVAAGAYGTCTNEFPALAATNGTASGGQLWGPRDDSWELEPQTGGFITVDLFGSGVAIVNRFPLLAFEGQYDADTAQGASGTVSIYWQGSDTGENMTSVLAVSQDFVTTDKINVSWLNQRWEAYCRESI